VVIGFLVTFLIGYVSSVILKELKLTSNNKIFIDGNKHLLNYDLFAPFVSKKLQRKHDRKSGKLIVSNDVRNY
jgi:hypothetical protein